MCLFFLIHTRGCCASVVIQQLSIFQCNHTFAMKGCETNIYTIQDGTTTSKLVQCIRRLPYDALWKMMNGTLRAVA